MHEFMNGCFERRLSVIDFAAHLLSEYLGKTRVYVNAKILKDIKFPLSLDVFDLCSPELQQKLVPMRTKFKVFR